MRTFPHAVVSATLLTLSLCMTSPRLGAQEITSQDQVMPHHKVLGYQDTETGVFHPLVNTIPEATVSPIAGTITVTLHITLKTAVPSGDKVACGVSLNASYYTAAASTAYEESAYNLVTPSGTSATCVLTIPHSWQFPAVVATDIESLTGSYVVEIINPSATLTTTSLLTRSSASSFVSLSGNNVFATAPTTYSINSTL